MDKWFTVLFVTVEPSIVIDMEACTGAQHYSKVLMSKGYELIIIAPQFV
jgi:transposase